MKPKEKAEELVIKYASLQITTIGCIESGNSCIIKSVMYKENAKQCALIAVDEILSLLPLANRDFWQQVKNEIKLL